jgi:hypothetical protein
MLVLLEFENTLVGIFVRVIAIVFEHAPAENCQRYCFYRIQCSSSTVRMVPKTKFCKEGSGILFLVSAGQKPETIFCKKGPLDLFCVTVIVV